MQAATFINCTATAFHFCVTGFSSQLVRDTEHQVHSHIDTRVLHSLFLLAALPCCLQVGLDLITSKVKTPRKTKIICTLGPSCWSEEGLGALIDAGMNVARFNFSHGDHAAHLEVLQRVRKVRKCGLRDGP
jgi:hypothetical protein